MNINKDLKVIVFNGYYDLVTPFHATEYTMDNMMLPADLKENITMKYYESGHMMYIHFPSLIKMTKDVEEFYLGAD